MPGSGGSLEEAFRGMPLVVQAPSGKYVADGVTCHGLTSAITNTLGGPGVGAARWSRPGSSTGRGIVVDKEISAYTKNSSKFKFKTREARSIVGVLRERGLRLVATQVPVATPAHRLVAVVDGIAVGAGGVVWFLEFKTGYVARRARVMKSVGETQCQSTHTQPALPTHSQTPSIGAARFGAAVG